MAMIAKTLLVILASTTTGYAGFVPSNGYFFQQNPIYQHPQPVYQQPLTHYTQPSFVQFHQASSNNRPQFVAIQAERPQQVTSNNRPQFVAIQADRPQQVTSNNRPQFVAIQAGRPQQVTSVSRPQFVAIHAEQPQLTATTSKPPTSIQYYPNVVATHAERPTQQTFRKLVLPYPPEEYYTVPNYSYGYSVKDDTTGDEKSHQETRTGDNVIGKYTVVEPDGTLRTVSYTAGKDGFNAVVKRTANYAPPNAPSKVILSKPIAINSSGYLKPVASAVAVPVSSNYPSGFHFGG